MNVHNNYSGPIICKIKYDCHNFKLYSIKRTPTYQTNTYSDHK